MHPFKHFKTITKHRHAVFRHCVKAGIPWQGLTHDLSKYAPIEFWNGARYYQGTRSPNAQEREEKGYSEAWLHHQGRNRHHFEYWHDFNVTTRRHEAVKMPLKYVAEMFCDRIAASKIYKGSEYKDTNPLEYFKHGNAKNMMHAETAAFLEKLLIMLANEGEDKTLAYLKNYMKNNKDY